MAGHSHWAGIKHKKALNDAKRGKLWSKLSKAIIVAAKMGGGDLDANFRLRTAVDDAKAARMPKDTITRAIKKGTGELAGSSFEETVYEGYGPGGVAVLCEVLTDNLNRTSAEIRKCFEIAHGKLGKSGCVAWMFEKKGLFLVPADKTDEETLMEITLDAGVEDIQPSGDSFELTCDPTAYRKVAGVLEAAGIEPNASQVTRVPKDTVDLDAPTARKVLKLMENLDDHDDVQSVCSNFNIPEEVMAEIGEE
jgi:YebC/PmpR family DNA-binding regulatory protein